MTHNDLRNVFYDLPKDLQNTIGFLIWKNNNKEIHEQLLYKMSKITDELTNRTYKILFYEPTAVVRYCKKCTWYDMWSRNKNHDCPVLYFDDIPDDVKERYNLYSNA